MAQGIPIAQDGRQSLLYRVRRTREQHIGDLVKRVLAGSKDRRAVFLGFARSVNPNDLDELRKVIRQVERERRMSG